MNWLKNLVYMQHNGVLFNHKEKLNFVICKKKGGPGDHHDK
jgi:hypothetical protein